MPVMPVPGLDPGIVAGIHVFLWDCKKDVDGRNKSGHDAVRACFDRDIRACRSATRYTSYFTG
jgi:hypothetical protein